MPRKLGSVYHEIKQQAYTLWGYIGGVPLSCITQFALGNKTEVLLITLDLYSKENSQIRH